MSNTGEAHVLGAPLLFIVRSLERYGTENDEIRFRATYKRISPHRRLTLGVFRG